MLYRTFKPPVRAVFQLNIMIFFAQHSKKRQNCTLPKDFSKKHSKSAKIQFFQTLRYNTINTQTIKVDGERCFIYLFLFLSNETIAGWLGNWTKYPINYSFVGLVLGFSEKPQRGSRKIGPANSPRQSIIGKYRREIEDSRQNYAKVVFLFIYKSRQAKQVRDSG